MSKTVFLNIPIKLEDILDLEIDDTVYLTGSIYTMMYADHYTKIFNLIEAGASLPFELEGGAIYHTGTIFTRNEDDTYNLISLGTTTSSKFDAYVPALIEKTGLRIVMGKGGMGKDTLNSMKKYGCVYLALAGGCSSAYTGKVEKMDKEIWPEQYKSWADSMVKLDVADFGPLFVTMDAHGNSVYEDVKNEVARCQEKLYKEMGII